MPKGFYEEKCDNFSQKKFTGMNHQKNLVKAFDNLAPGVRGLCVFWQLGCGKTCAAIMVADNLLKKKEIDRVYVLSPGSLRSTWVAEYCEKCGIIQNINKYRFMTYNYSVTISQFHKITGLETFEDRSLVIIDEVHGLLNGVSNQSTMASEFYHMMMESKCKILCLTGTLDRFDFVGLLIKLLKPGEEVAVTRKTEEKNEKTVYNAKQYGFELEASLKIPDLKNKISKNIKGIISFFSGLNKDEMPEITYHNPIKVEFSFEQESYYWDAYSFETSVRKPPASLQKSNPGKYIELMQIFVMCKKKMISRMISNFKYPSFFVKKEIYISGEGKRLKTKFKDKNRSDSLSRFGGWIDYSLFQKGQLKKYSPKMVALITNIILHSNQKQVVFTSFKTRSGARLIFSILKMIGFNCLIFSGDSSESEKRDILDKFNAFDNLRGERYRVLILTEAGSQGISLIAVRHIHIFESSDRFFRTKQAIGRVSRFLSHSKLSKEERTVDVWRYWSISKQATITILRKNKDGTEKKTIIDDTRTIDQILFEKNLKQNNDMQLIEDFFKENSVTPLDSSDFKSNLSEDDITLVLDPDEQDLTEMLQKYEQNYVEYNPELENKMNEEAFKDGENMVIQSSFGDEDENEDENEIREIQEQLASIEEEKEIDFLGESEKPTQIDVSNEEIDFLGESEKPAQIDVSNEEIDFLGESEKPAQIDNKTDLIEFSSEPVKIENVSQIDFLEKPKEEIVQTEQKNKTDLSSEQIEFNAQEVESEPVNETETIEQSISNQEEEIDYLA